MSRWPLTAITAWPPLAGRVRAGAGAGAAGALTSGASRSRGDTRPKPSAAYRSSSLPRPWSAQIFASVSWSWSVLSGTDSLRASRSSRRRPVSIASSFSPRSRYARIFFLVRAHTANSSQSRLGTWLEEVRISTMSPLASGVRSGTRRPLIRAPTQWWPTSECTR